MMYVPYVFYGAWVQCLAKVDGKNQYVLLFIIKNDKSR